MEKISVAVVGAGETGTPLIRQLLDAGFVDMLMVADLSDQRPGMVLARERDVPTTNDFMDIARMGARVDVIIDVSGAREVREQLRQHFRQHANHHTVLAHEMVAVLMMSLSQGRLVCSKHGWIDYG